MTRNRQLLAIAACAVLALNVVEASDTTAKSKVYKVDAVTLSVAGAAKIKVVAKGTVRTGGWADPQLVPSARPADAASRSDIVTLHFDFVATKPTGIVTQALSPITAETSCPAPGADKTLKIVIHAETNEKSDSIKSPNDPR